MRKSNKKNKTGMLLFSVLSLLGLGIIGFLLSDTGKQFYEPASRAELLLKCKDGRYCSLYPVTGATKCKSPNGPQIWCCPANQILDDMRTKCISTSTPTSIPSCGQNPNCYDAKVPGSSACKLPSDGSTVWCCPVGQVFAGGKCSSTSNNPSSLPSKIPKATSSPVEPVNPTTTANPTVSTSPIISSEPTTIESPVTTQTSSRTPSVTHTPSETGFAEDVLLYIGGTLYVIGVIAFISVRLFTSRNQYK